MKTQLVQNPILPGFNPDPSILRVGDDYYIATSTFEWVPGVQIHHSRDLVHWRLLTHPLTNLDLRGIPSRGGIWAPCLSYDKGTFYLIYTVVYGHQGVFKDLDNYLITAKAIEGPWTEPIRLNSTGFDPSLFHDEDGRKWLVNMSWDFRKDHPKFGGILLQEYDPKAQKLIGPIQNIYSGTELGTTEGPHLYRHNGYYYLMTAEGGTGYNHAVSMARSKSIFGPYENDPIGLVVTTKDFPDYPLQKAGHGDLVQTQTGEWYLVHLASRPFPGTRECILGRETCLQKVCWTNDGWLRLESGGSKPQLIVPAPDLPAHSFEALPTRDDFDSKTLRIHYQTLYAALGEEKLSLTARPGFLRLYGGPSFAAPVPQSLIVRRQQSWNYTAETLLEFEPNEYRQMAGLVCLHDTGNFLYLRVSRDDGKKMLGIMANDNNAYSYPIDDIPLPEHKAIRLRVEVKTRDLQFYYSVANEEFKSIGPVFDTVALTDDHSALTGYTGAFVGLCCQDLTGQKTPADFDYFDYSEDGK
ncbi:MAG TPA: glycoside hydrolase family 43 protein [Oscillospiraceae bacterium]|mgnify:CR=1 FL=1|nr:glycoside hydrolase family 43 protein [Oscillospiraceae bacterium]HPF54958.1 glycoside hydrolase family 43 protein [Clostridiales bacterium]HPK34371.1 glycoside hydrolase family 43 protein [Oscillospiraceae bacterium]HPR75817.1 glycoside hydrolase family 43 protein [Oscillospiraceae bacterium]